MKFKAYRFTPVGKLEAANNGAHVQSNDWFIYFQGAIIAQVDETNTVVHIGHGHCFLNFVDDRLEEFETDFTKVKFDRARFAHSFRSYYPEIEIASELLRQGLSPT